MRKTRKRGLYMWFVGAVAFVAAILAAVAAVIAQAQAAAGDPTVTTVHLSPEVWLALAGILVTVGASIEQLRRARVDIRSWAAKIDGLEKRLPDEYVRRDFWLARMQSIEENQRVAALGQERIERRIDALLMTTKQQ